MVNRRTPLLLATSAPLYVLLPELQRLGQRGLDLVDHESHALAAAFLGQCR